MAPMVGCWYGTVALKEVWYFANSGFRTEYRSPSPIAVDVFGGVAGIVAGAVPMMLVWCT